MKRTLHNNNSLKNRGEATMAAKITVQIRMRRIIFVFIPSRPVENSYTYGFRSHGTKLNVRKLRRFAVQKFERQNRGRIFSRCSRKFDRCALKTSEHHKRPIFFTVKAWLRKCEAAQLEEESTEAAILIALLGNITALMENIIIQMALTCTAYQAGKRRCVSALLQAESRIQKRRLAIHNPKRKKRKYWVRPGRTDFALVGEFWILEIAPCA